MNEKMDMRISGSSTMPGGEYDRVSISGSGTVQGDLRCQSLSCSGSARVQGDVDCAGEVRSSGSSKVTGSITCESLSCSGAVKCEGSILSRGRTSARRSWIFSDWPPGTACHWCGSPCIPAAPTRSGCSLPAGASLWWGTGNTAAPGTARRWPCGPGGWALPTRKRDGAWCSPTSPRPPGPGPCFPCRKPEDKPLRARGPAPRAHFRISRGKIYFSLDRARIHMVS